MIKGQILIIPFGFLERVKEKPWDLKNKNYTIFFFSNFSKDWLIGEKRKEEENKQTKKKRKKRSRKEISECIVTDWFDYLTSNLMNILLVLLSSTTKSLF